MSVYLDRADRLVKADLSGEDGYLDTELLRVMYNVETALLATGAEPNIDYGIVKLAELAQPYVLAINSANDLKCSSPFKKRK